MPDKPFGLNSAKPGAAALRQPPRVSEDASAAWQRLPGRIRAEVLEALDTPRHEGHPTGRRGKPPALKAHVLPSGFCVVYESGNDGNTVWTVLTPRERCLIGA